MTAYEMRISDWSSDVCSSDLSVLVAVLVDILAFVAFVDDDLARRTVGDRTSNAGLGEDAGGAIGVADLDRAVVHHLVVAVDGDRGAAGRLDRAVLADLDVVARARFHGRCLYRRRGGGADG